MMLKPTLVVAAVVTVGVLLAVTRPDPVRPLSTDMLETMSPLAVHESIELTDESTQWFLPFETYCADRAFNPTGRDVVADERARVEAVLASAQADLTLIAELFTRIQVEIAKEHIQRGTAERYEPGTPMPSKEDYAAVVILSTDASTTWLVRISHEEFPEEALLREDFRQLHERTLTSVRDAFRT